MSGGSWNYVFHYLDDIADRLERSRSTTRKAFAQHIRLISKAMYNIEWADSGNIDDKDAIKAINAVFEDKKTLEARQIEILKEEGKEIIKQLNELIDNNKNDENNEKFNIRLQI